MIAVMMSASVNKTASSGLNKSTREAQIEFEIIFDDYRVCDMVLIITRAIQRAPNSKPPGQQIPKQRISQEERPIKRVSLAQELRFKRNKGIGTVFDDLVAPCLRSITRRQAPIFNKTRLAV